ncbi:GGDEF domain-containing protein [Endothiovibrio diazotrophicus]
MESAVTDAAATDPAERATPIRVGIVGGGRGGSALLDVLLHTPAAEVVAICDLDPNAAAMGLARHHGIPTYGKIEILIERHPLDWLLNVSHASITQRHLLSRTLKAVTVVDGATAELIWRVLLETHGYIEQADNRHEADTLHALAWRLIRHIVDSQQQLQQELTGIAFRDPLTGLYTRRMLMDFLDRQVKAARRHDHPLSVVLADIDHFKLVNDTFGHDAGDRVLRELGELLSKMVRSSDLEARLGGEEFAVILPFTDRSEAAMFAERVREKVTTALHRPDGQPLTLSLGVATRAPGENVDAPTLLSRADEALYRAKAGGRDRVELEE